MGEGRWCSEACATASMPYRRSSNWRAGCAGRGRLFAAATNPGFAGRATAVVPAPEGTASTPDQPRHTTITTVPSSAAQETPGSRWRSMTRLPDGLDLDTTSSCSTTRTRTAVGGLTAGAYDHGDQSGVGGAPRSSPTMGVALSRLYMRGHSCAVEVAAPWRKVAWSSAQKVARPVGAPHPCRTRGTELRAETDEFKRRQPDQKEAETPSTTCCGPSPWPAKAGCWTSGRSTMQVRCGRRATLPGEDR